MHPQLISRELFENVRCVTHTQPAGRAAGAHYLKGSIVCAECGSKLYYVVAKSWFGYFGVSAETPVESAAPATPRSDRRARADG
jgi:hypothetical protein